ncbi:MAG: Sir2 family NAD-dependent protein deacetylase [Pseudomonadota bacterium]|nr:Sir2 family NAD-dependent protein deacetylase [Pseudomonadota bacterium]
MDDGISQLSKLIDDATRTVVFTGAGISTESGIPDFRSPNGIWSQTSPIYFDEYITSSDARIEAWRRKFEIDRDMVDAEPNRGHRAVAKLVSIGKVKAVITQNIDGLHQKSGVPDHQMIELHGNGTYATCLSCEKRFELEPIKAAFEADSTLPVCDDCGGIVKTATVSFGQAMPNAKMDRAREETFSSDLFLAVGSSLVVYPAAGFPEMAKKNGARLVIINRDPTDLDGIADLVLNSEIGPTLGEAANVN